MGEAVEGVEVFGAGVLDDLVGQLGAGGGFVPGGEGREVIAEVLLVEAGLGTAGLVGVDRPEAGAVGGEDFVGEEDAFVFRTAVGEAEFEFGIREEDAALGGVGGGPGVKVEREVAEFFVPVIAENGAGFGGRKVFVMAVVVFAGGREERFGQAVGFAEAMGNAMAADRSMKAIFLPAGTGEMAAGDAFDGEDFAAAGAGEAALEFGQVDAGGEIVAEDVVGADVFGEAKPMPGERGEDFALVGDGGGHDDVVGGDAVRGDEPDFVMAGVDVADLALAQKGDVGLGETISE